LAVTAPADPIWSSQLKKAFQVQQPFGDRN
jgi:hypothetical protein